MTNLIFKIDEIVTKALANKYPLANETNILFNHFNQETLDLIFNTLTNFGEGCLELILITFCFYKLWKEADKRKWSFYIKGVILSFLSSGIIVSILKRVVGRARPYVSFDPSQFYGFQYLVEHDLISKGRYHSFPSGHTITVFTTIWFIFLNTKNIYLKYSLVFLGLIVGFSRIYLSYHWTSDVLFSIILSYGIAKTIDMGLKKDLKPRDRRRLEFSKIFSWRYES